jgi:hypothetical protein
MNVWANTVITEKGLALLAKLTQGNTLKITEAVTGAGFVTPGLLMKQTEVSDPQQALTFRSVTYPEEGKCSIPMALTNAGLAAGYKATQVGVFATDPDEGKILFFIAQSVDAASGTNIPSEAEMAGYSAEWTFYFKYGQADGVVVAVNPSNTVSRAEIEAMLVDKEPARFDMTLSYGEEESCTIDKTFAELQEAYQAGRQIRLVDTSGMEFELLAFGADNMAYFAHQLDSHRYIVRIRANNTVTLISDYPFSEKNPPTAAQVGAKRSNNVSITSGSIKTWALEQPTSTSVGVHTGVTDLPETGSYWFVDLTVANSGMWRKLIATKTSSTGAAPTSYECTCMSNNWSPWVKSGSSGDMAFTESSSHPGCFFRTSGNITEWLNPPMVVGTEYRTTERYNGKVVYTKSVSFGTMPNSTNTSKKVEHKISGITAIVAQWGVAYYSYTGGIGCYFPTAAPKDSYTGYVELYVNATNIEITTSISGWQTDNTATYVTIKYTKD